MIKFQRTTVQDLKPLFVHHALLPDYLLRHNKISHGKDYSIGIYLTQCDVI